MSSSATPAGVRDPACSEEGSAYVLVLLVLVVLTLTGMALALVSHTESEIGANERLATGALYAAESGVSMTVARALTANDHRAHIYWYEDTVVGTLRRGHRIEVSPLQPIASGPCNLCEINQGALFARISHGIESTAMRAAAAGSGDPSAATAASFAERTLSTMVDLEPREPTVESLRASEGYVGHIRY